MSCRMNSGIYAINTTSGSSITNGGVYTPTTLVTKRGCAVNLSTNGFTIDTLGCHDVSYDVYVSASLEGLTADTPVTITLTQDGTPIPGLTATQTLGSANDIVSLNMSGTVVVRRCSKSLFTIVVSGQDTESYNLAVNVRMV